MELTDAIHSLADANRQLLSTGARATRDALLAVGDDTSTYGRSGSIDAGTVRRVFVDEAI
jgi:hypothetical protein